MSVIGILRAWRLRTHQRSLWREWGLDRLNHEYVEREGTVVKSGPFRGLAYPKEAATSVDALIPKLLGVYENQLYPWLSKEWTNFTDIGAADGYYAVGMAIRGAHVTAVDIDPWARRACRQLARLNGVDDRIEVRGSLPRIRDGGLVLSDCEGAEVEIFSPDLISRLKTSHVLIELHDFLRDVPVKELMLDRFRQSHRATVIPDNSMDTHPVLAYWDSAEQRLALSEHRPTQEWLWFEPL